LAAKEETAVALIVQLARHRKVVVLNANRVVPVNMAMGAKIVLLVNIVKVVILLLHRVEIAQQVTTIIRFVKDLVCRVFLVLIKKLQVNLRARSALKTHLVNKQIQQNVILVVLVPSQMKLVLNVQSVMLVKLVLALMVRVVSANRVNTVPPV